MKFVGAQPSVILELSSYKILIDALEKFLGNIILLSFNLTILSCKCA